MCYFFYFEMCWTMVSFLWFYFTLRKEDNEKVDTVFADIRKDEIPDVPSNFLYRGKKADEIEKEIDKKNEEEKKDGDSGRKRSVDFQLTNEDQKTFKP